MRILVTGDRAWDDLETVIEVVSRYPVGSVFVHGYADGLDCCVDVVARELGHTVIRCPSHWRCNVERWVEVYGPCPPDCSELSGKKAGVLRNKYMLETQGPFDIVLGFHNSILESKGTKDMLRRAQRAKIKNILYTSDGGEVENPVLTNRSKSSKLDKTVTMDHFFNF